MNKRIITASVAAIVLAFAGTLRADYNPLKLGWENFSLYTNGSNVADMEVQAAAATYTTTISGQSYKLTGSWSSGEDFSDEVSTVVGGEFKLNTDGAVVTNTLLDAATLNGVLAGDITEYDEDAVNGDVFIKTTATFVPTDSLEDFSAEGDESDLKFAIYAYADEDASPATTNLVIYHKYWDADSTGHYVTDVFSNLLMSIDFSQPVGLEITVRDPYGEPFRFFKVKVEQGGASEVLTSEFGASDGNIDPDSVTPAIADGGPWFMTANGENEGLKDLSSLSFKGTGTISDIQVGIYTDGEPPTPPETYTVDWTGSKNVVVSNGTEEVSGTSGSFAAGTVLVFYPTEGSITNVNGTAQDPGLASYSYTVTTAASQSLFVLAGEEEVTPPAPTLYNVDWTDSVNVEASTNGTTIAATSGSFEAGTELTFTATVGSITNVTGYVTATPTNAFVYVVTTDVPQTLVVLAGVEPEPPAPTKPEWFDDNAAADVAAAYDTWAAGQSVSDLATTDYSAQFLMNVDATVSVVALTIDAIEITEEGTQITVGATGDNVGIDLEQINGVLNVYVAETLGVWEHKSIPAANLEYDAAGKAIVIIPATEGKFVKASVDYAEGEDGDIDEVAQP